MATIINSKDILSIVKDIDVVAAMEEGFIAYSNEKTVVPPVAELLFEDPKGETHIKYGYIKEDDYYVVKIASGFYENSKLGISSSQGLMLLFSQKTGEPRAILLDEGRLTDIRTAAAGALAAKYFAPQTINAIGIIGTGIQAKLQLKHLKEVTSCNTVWIWGRSAEKVEQFKTELTSDYTIHVANNTSEVAQHCNLIVTTTPSERSLLLAKDVQPGTHITAVGSDTSDKQELESELLKKADLVVVDSISQSKSRGEVFKAVKNGSILLEKVDELGKAIQDRALQRADDSQITIVDLTGVAVQDIMIAKAVYNNYKK